jgi:predicted transcriptional regulator
MRSKALEKKRILAVEMRKTGMTYNEIASTLGVAKSTLGGWVKNIFPPKIEAEIKKIAEQKYREKTIAWAKYRSRLINEKAKNEQIRYARQIKKLTNKDLFFLGLGLYWAEGAKTELYKYTFFNSDPFINKSILKFIYSFLGAKKEQIKIQMVLHLGIDEEMAKNYWSKTLSLNQKNFNRASYSLSAASKGRRPKNRLPYGTIQITVSGKKYANMIKGWLQGLENKFS